MDVHRAFFWLSGAGEGEEGEKGGHAWSIWLLVALKPHGLWAGTGQFLRRIFRVSLCKHKTSGVGWSGFLSLSPTFPLNRRP